MTGADPWRPLKLRARDDEDLAILSAQLQDAIAVLGDMTYLADERRFVMVVNRFKWEAGAVPGPAEDLGSDEPEVPHYLRTHAGVRIEGVTNVRSRDIDRGRRDRILNLLAMRAEDGTILLEFSEGGTIRLTVDGIDCLLEDRGEPWPTVNRPGHPVNDPANDEASDPAG
ncbi:MAG: DUF2948 family protein [Inquilinaceae bacterium]